MFTTPEQVFSVNHRPRIEKQILKRTNLIVFTGVFLCFAVTVTRVHDAAMRSLDGAFWIPGDFKLDSQLSTELGTCSHSATLRISSYDVLINLDSETRSALMAYTAALVRRSMWVNGGAVFASLGNKVLFDRNIHELAWGLVVIPKGFLMLLEIVLIIWAIVSLEQPQAGCDIISNYIKGCSPGSNDRHLWAAQPFVAMFFAWGVVLLVHALTFYLYIQRTAGYYYHPFPRVRRAWLSLYSIVALRKNNYRDQSKIEIVAQEMLSEIKDSLRDEPPLISDANPMHQLGAVPNTSFRPTASSAPSAIYANVCFAFFFFCCTDKVGEETIQIKSRFIYYCHVIYFSRAASKTGCDQQKYIRLLYLNGFH